MINTFKDISIIIPCYNTQSLFLEEAISSVKVYKGEFSYEIIIVDDGSSDIKTTKFLDGIEDDTIKIIYQPNGGPAVARNTGVKNSGSEFVLFLDSDDKIKPNYIDEGIKRLKKYEHIGVVYANADSFGDNSRENFKALPFDIATLLIRNYIPMCVVMRRKIWEEVGGIDEQLIQYEDWEFWIRIYKAGWKFEFLTEPMFDYRIQNTSLIAQDPNEKFRQAVAYIYKKHWDLVYEVFHQLYAGQIIYNNDMEKPLRSFFKYSKKKFLS